MTFMLNLSCLCPLKLLRSMVWSLQTLFFTLLWSLTNVNLEVAILIWHEINFINTVQWVFSVCSNSLLQFFQRFFIDSYIKAARTIDVLWQWPWKYCKNASWIINIEWQCLISFYSKESPQNKVICKQLRFWAVRYF